MANLRVSTYREMRVWAATGSGSIHFDSAAIGEPDLGHIVENRVTQLALWERLERLPEVDRLCPAKLATLAQAREGQRNDKLNNAAFSLGQFVGAGLLTRPEVEAMLTNTAQALGLGEMEIQKTIKSGLEAGLANPRRSWPELNQTNFSRSPRR